MGGTRSSGTAGAGVGGVGRYAGLPQDVVDRIVRNEAMGVPPPTDEYLARLRREAANPTPRTVSPMQSSLENVFGETPTTATTAMLADEAGLPRQTATKFYRTMAEEYADTPDVVTRMKQVGLYEQLRSVYGPAAIRARARARGNG